MKEVTHRGYSPAGLAVVLAVHAFLLYAILLEYPGRGNTPTARYSQLLLITVSEPRPVTKIPEPARIPAPKTRPVKPATAAAPAKIQSLPPVETPPAAAAGDPFNESARVDIASLVKQAGKADRETRSAREMEKYGPARDSMEAVMTRAFHAAKLAVPLKWYEAARIELFSAPNDPKPIYQVTTAFGIYCLYYPDKLREGTGQPKMAGCPRTFK